jgi:hypothetical protein
MWLGAGALYAVVYAGEPFALRKTETLLDGRRK